MTNPPSTELDVAKLTSEEITARIVELRRTRVSFLHIGNELGMSRQAVHDRYWRAMEARIAPGVAALRQDQNDIYEDLLERNYEIANRKHVLVSGGTIVRGEDGEPLYDDGPALRAHAEIRATVQAQAKLNGTEAPVQAVINGSIHYEVVGVNMDNLR